MIECPNCGKKNSDENKFCGECGYPLPEPENYCPECDRTFKKGEKFCTQCGHVLINECEYRSEQQSLEEQRRYEEWLEEQRLEILEIKTKICPKCNVTLGKKLKKCPKCGYKFKK